MTRGQMTGQTEKKQIDTDSDTDYDYDYENENENERKRKGCPVGQPGANLCKF
jgi:hypothetical protein